MRLRRLVGERPAQNGRGHSVVIGLYYCPGCDSEVEWPISVGRNQEDCGCLKKDTERRVPTIYRPKPAERTCLMCSKKFISRGPHNRRCGVCENTIERGGQAYYMPPVHRHRDKSVVAGCGEL